jgi:hypothetical protein
MRVHRPTAVFLALAGAAAASLPVSANPIELTWADLIPESARTGGQVTVLEGIVQHNQVSQAPEAAAGNTPVAIEDVMGISSTVAYRTDLAGAEVTIQGYLLPLELEGAEVVNFLLVPFVGACIHVPPPPANQLVLVDFPEGFASTGLWQPIAVTGTLELAGVSTELAEIGYSIKATAVQGI